jgi:protein SCO1/2
VKVQKELGERLGNDVFFYSITLDPMRDTPGVLKKYAIANGAKTGWSFLTGNARDIEKIRRSLGMVDSDPEIDKDYTQHTGMIVIGNEKLDFWTSASVLTSAKNIHQMIGWMKPAGIKTPN